MYIFEFSRASRLRYLPRTWRIVMRTKSWSISLTTTNQLYRECVSLPTARRGRTAFPMARRRNSLTSFDCVGRSVYELCVSLVLICFVYQSQTDAFSFGARSLSDNLVQQRQSSGIDTTKSSVALVRTRQQRSRLILDGFLDGIFGSGDNDDTAEDGVLSTITVGEFDEETIQVRYDSLSDYITDKWMDLFESKSISLTTPVKVFKRSNID